MRNLLAVSIVALAAMAAGCKPQGATDTATGTATGEGGAATGNVDAQNPQTEDQKTLYALGLSIGRSVSVFDMSPEELQFVKAGIEAEVLDKEPAVKLEEYNPKLQALARTRSTARAEKEKEKGKEFLEKMAKEEGAKRTESGLIYKELTPGTGESPTAESTVKVHYRGTLPDGTEFDSSHKRGQPATFPLRGVIKCWTEGVAMMKVGGKAQLVCPSDIAYGDRGSPPMIPGGATLVFEVELLEVVKPQTPPGQTPPAPGTQPKR